MHKLVRAGFCEGQPLGHRACAESSANTRDQATTIVPLALVPQLILAGVLVPKLPDLATAVAKIAVSGYWLTEAMKSVFIAAEGPIRTMNAHTGTLMSMTAEPARPSDDADIQ